MQTAMPLEAEAAAETGTVSTAVDTKNGPDAHNGENGPENAGASLRPGPIPLEPRSAFVGSDLAPDGFGRDLCPSAADGEGRSSARAKPECPSMPAARDEQPSHCSWFTNRGNKLSARLRMWNPADYLRNAGELNEQVRGV